MEYRPGSKADFDRLYQATYQRVFRTLAAMLGDPAGAEDCAQDAFLKAYRAWPRWKGDSPAEAWIHRIAMNVALTYLKRSRLGEVGELIRRLGRPEPERDPSDVVEGRDLFRALRELSPDQAALIILRHHHGYTNREIAYALKTPESTIASRLAKAKARIREVLNWPDEDETPPRADLVVSRAESKVVFIDGPEADQRRRLARGGAA